MSPAVDVTPLATLKNRYLDTLVRGDAGGAAAIIEQALLCGHPTVTIYLSVLMPAQTEIGDLWHASEVNAATEHVATVITEEQMMRLRERSKPKEKLGLFAVIASVEGEMHSLGPRLIADFLYLDGWDTAFMGCNTPTEDLVEFSRHRRPDLVALAVTMEQNLTHLRRAMTLLRQLAPAPKLLAGGAAFAGASGPGESVGADWLTSDPLEAVRMARRLVGQPESPRGLSVYLSTLGQRIVEYRRQHGFSQQELADRADLDRTYISAVERGKQNITIGALIRIASALDTSIERLVAPR